ncbi:hypothetical protein [Shewanella sp. 10N.286.52.B9]|uniref:hypothetical protein n=1 Tax=Shewanella sp. 10N.286.52.B9 TaxID=1880837 RepID=UPI000CAE028F|nr:hypothetical protein [Shewanella sp. 10N.286.52.B9]PMG48072.1 hypothetical protein BCU91_03015 [Shewanella sp. 10N.286.52.B9]
MISNPSLVTRTAVGKLIGLAFGVLCFWIVPWLAPETSLLFLWGLLLWYITFGAIIGLAGVFDYHPVLKIAMPWWLTATIMGGWMNLVFTFVAYDQIQALMVAIFGLGGSLQSPFWFVADGLIAGWIIGYFATKFGGYGPSTAGR